MLYSDWEIATDFFFLFTEYMYSTKWVNVIIMQSGNVSMRRLMENFQHNNWKHYNNYVFYLIYWMLIDK